jgi:hypothetical protein
LNNESEQRVTQEDGSGTDEPIEQSVQQKKDFEAELMRGCLVIGAASLITYALCVWPFTAFPEYSVVGLSQIAATGLLPSLVFGIFMARRAGLAGGTGFFGGALAAAVFMHLRLQQTALGYITKDMPRPDYPAWIGWALPPIWVVIAGLAALVFSKGESVEA